MSTTKIIVVCHKADPNIKQDEIHFPIQVGRDLTDVDLGFQGDNTGDNISKKNRTYCELTAHYWAWKNLTGVDYVGLAHYRRYFKGLNNSEQIHKILSSKDIILLKRTMDPGSNRIRFEQLCSMEELLILMDVIHDIYPEYYDAAVKYLRDTNKWVRCNMFILPKEKFNDYSAWLFSILEKAEQKCLLSSYTRMRRVYGYMGEILLGIYVQQNKLKPCYVETEDYSAWTTSRLGDFIRDKVSNNLYLKFIDGSIKYHNIKNEVLLSIGFFFSNQVQKKRGFIQDDVRAGLKADNIEIKV